jgi:hypothetical protein
VLRDPSGKKLLLIDLKGRDEPIAAPHREELIRLARSLAKGKGGFVQIVLLGVSVDKRKAVGDPFEEKAYAFEGTTFEDLARRAQKRLEAERGPSSADEAEVLRAAEELNEAEIAELMGLPDSGDVMATAASEASASQLSLV